MTLTFQRLVKKKINFRVDVFTVITMFIIVIAFYSLLSKECTAKMNPVTNKPNYRLIVLILTSPGNMKQRDTIRKTWISDRNFNVKHFFAIGTLNIDQEQLETLQSEQQKFKDLLFLPKLQDSYGTLTKKVLQSFQKIYEDYTFDYLLKCDDDSFVLLQQLLVNLQSWEAKGTRKELYWGFFNGKAHVKRRGPWKEPEWNLCDYYLPYAVGGGYVLSYNLVKYIAVNADNLRLFNAEDVSVGLWLAPVANIERKHDIRFDTEYRSRGCSNQYLITHKQSSESIQSVHNHYQTSGNLCAQEVSERMSYQYNWTAPPSQCCERKPGLI
ncbi:beta-1,3-galactosyltransferase 6 [Chelonus insularis]|uniref:beta-1,3-galactosyltransferase 6 n=1 Tax=Chelonus insularis TaxID=460826 RepID=UPI00158DE41E|nr:beta-1,3-galactosyltransferase 6 [Chelonus insularis]